MNERKKNLPKRLLAMTLALSMCAGLSCTTAFATNADVGDGSKNDVYVYVNVTDTTTEHAKGDAPVFDAKSETEALESSKTAISAAKGEVDEATPDSTGVENAKTELDNAGSVVEGALKDLEGAEKPSYNGPEYTPDAGTTDPIDPVDPVDPVDPGNSQDPQDTPEKKPPVNSEFTGTVNKEVTDLNNAQTEMGDKVDNAQKGLGAAELAVQQATDALKQVIENAKLTEAQKDATDKINAANALIDAYEGSRSTLDQKLESDIAALEKPSETAPVQEEGQSYADYKAAHGAWVDACNKYNDDLSALKTKYEADAQKLVDDITAATDAATAAIGTAQGALDSIKDSEKKTELDAANSVLDGYTGALKGYNDKVNGYNDKVNGYNQVATGEGGYNDKVDAYNTEVGKYNNAVDAYDGKVIEYNNSVKEYQKKADAYNQVVTEYNDEAQTWNKDAVVADSSALTSFAQKNTSSNIDLAKLQEALSTINGIKVEMKSDTTQAGNPVSKLSNEDVTKYNEAVRTYNAAVKAYNTQNTVEYKIKEVSKYFEGQNAYENTDYEGKEWYTVGKITIGDGIFSKKPGQILNEVLTNDKVLDHTYTEADKNIIAGDGLTVAAGRDIYYFDVGADGTVKITAPANRQDQVNDSVMFNDGQDMNTLKQALDVTGDNGSKFEQKFEKKGETNADFDPYKDVSRWVLKVSYTAADYNTGNVETLHLDGYVYVRQLSELALLQEWEDTSAYLKENNYAENMDQLGESAKKADAVKLDPANGYDKADADTNIDKVEVPTLSFPWMSVFASKDPATVPNGIEITDPTPEPTTPPTPPTPPSGGGGGGGGNDNPPVDIPEEDPPLVDVPEEDPPLVDVPEEEPPLVDAPEEDPVLDIPEEEPPLVAPPTTVVITETKTPLVKAPAGVDIVDEAVPLADVPKTGDNTALWIAMALASVSALAVLAPRKKENG